VLVDPSDYVREQQRRMQQAAAELRFETAGKIKAYIDQLSQLGKGPFRHAARLADFQYLSFQRGPRAGTAKLFLIMPGQIEQFLCVIDESFSAGEILRVALTRAADGSTAPITSQGVERIGIVAHHLFSAKSAHGVFLPMARVDEKSIAKAWRDLQKQKVQEEVDAEGVVKELQAL
jgi:excinuclease UvrABC nuclease subunit